MPREAIVLEASRRLRARRPRSPAEPLARTPLRVVDVALLHCERGGEIRAYLDAKAAWAQRSGLIEHHLIVPGRAERHADGRHELPALRLAAINGCRLPLGARALDATLRHLRPDVVCLHDPLGPELRVTRTARQLGALVVAVRHGPAHPLLRTSAQRAYDEADAVMAVVDPRAQRADPTTIPLRFGLHPAFVPQPHVRRQDHVLYAGRLTRDKGVVELLQAAARATEPWQLKLVGRGPLEQRLRRAAARLGIAERVRFHPFIGERERLARWYASARVVVMPGAHETFGLVGLEAAACGASVVTCSTAPSAALMRGLVQTYAPGDIDALLAAIERGRATQPDIAAAAVLGKRHSSATALAGELLQLERLTGRRRLG